MHGQVLSLFGECAWQFCQIDVARLRSKHRSVHIPNTNPRREEERAEWAAGGGSGALFPGSQEEGGEEGGGGGEER
eukprot:7427102-Alexandrium_andersonii.AAC.1